MPVVVTIGIQRGDEGKSKAADQFGQDVDYIVRFNSGNNAGYTVVIDGERFALHLLPADVPILGATPIIGNGVVVDLEVLFSEIAEITSHGKGASNLLISANAHIIPPYNQALDRTIEHFLGTCRLGTIGRRIGPTYVNKVNRVGTRVQDLFDESTLRQRVRSALDQKNNFFLKVSNRVVINVDAVTDELLSYADRVRPMVVDYSLVLNHTLDQGEIVLFEAGRAMMLDTDHGIYPFVTPSNPTADGACTGTDVGSTWTDLVAGVVKAYTIRMGEGPFPTESFDDIGERLCTEGGEYRVTTGGPRHCGWYDAVVTCYVAHVDRLTDLVMTKLNVLARHKTIPMCVAYDIDGTVIQEMSPTQPGFRHATFVYEELPGWNENISEVRNPADLPQTIQDYALRIEELARCRTSAIGVRPGHEATISRHSLIG